MSEEIERHIIRKFEISQRLGKGAYGVVWKAVDKRSRVVVALKKCFDAFRNATDAQRTFREIMYLQVSQKMFIMTSITASDTLYELDLHAVIRAGILADIHKKYIIWQLLKALKYLHSAGLIHRDIKPSNVLLNSDCHIKLCDFGLCRSAIDASNGSDTTVPVLTDYVATRWYRAPEILLGSTRYTQGVDIFALGTILGEMINRKPVFPGTSTMNQIERIIEVITMPPKEDIDAIASPFAGTMLESLPVMNYKTISQVFPNSLPEGHDFIRSCLFFNPEKRPSAAELLKHVFVTEFHIEEEEPDYPLGLLRLPVDDNVKLTPAQYRERLYQEITNRRRESRRRSLHDDIARNGSVDQSTSESVSNAKPNENEAEHGKSNG